MIPRLKSALAVLLLVVLVPAAAAAQSIPDAVIGDVDAYWSTAFAEAIAPYGSPGIVAVTAPLETACGAISPEYGPGAYCRADGTVYYAPGWFDLANAEAAYAFATVLAHEWGHHLQALRGIVGATIDLELQADCLAGAYLRSAQDRGLLDAGQFSQGVGLAARAGDVLPVDGAAHGSPAERATAVMNGFQGGPTGCGIF